MDLTPVTVRDQLVNKKFSVLNHGHIILLDFMGSDQDVVLSARTSYQKGTKSVSDDRVLIRYLMRHFHFTPFECPVLRFHIKLPIFVERQWVRSRTCFGMNEVSARYSELPEEYYVPIPDSIRQQSKVNKQGRDEPVDVTIATSFIEDTEKVALETFDQYHHDLGNGIARELARINLPLGTYTEKVWSMNLRNLLEFLVLRMDSHAQWEIRQYATIIGEQIVAPLFPLVWESFVDYRLQSLALSRLEIEWLNRIMSLPTGISGDHKRMVQPEEWKSLEKCRERDEAIEKFKLLGVII